MRKMKGIQIVEPEKLRVIDMDMPELDEKNKRLNEKYNDHMKKLAAEVLRR